jgi:hypothetical protein
MTADGHYSSGSGNDRSSFAVGIPTGGAEGKELRRVGQVYDAAAGRMRGFTQERVSQIFAGYENPIGLELANLLAEDLYAARRVFDGEDGDGRMKAQLGAFTRRRRRRWQAACNGHLVQPDQVACGCALARRHITGIALKPDPHALGGILLFGQEGADFRVAQTLEFLDQLVIISARPVRFP